MNNTKICSLKEFLELKYAPLLKDVQYYIGTEDETCLKVVYILESDGRYVDGALICLDDYSQVIITKENVDEFEDDWCLVTESLESKEIRDVYEEFKSDSVHRDVEKMVHEIIRLRRQLNVQ